MTAVVFADHLLSCRLVYVVSSATATPMSTADTPPMSANVSGDSLVRPWITSLRSVARLPVYAYASETAGTGRTSE